MPLVLGRHAGEDFYIADVRFEVAQIDSPYRFFVKKYEKGRITAYGITEDRSIEVLPDVKISAGINKTPKQDGVKLAIDAPKNVRIYRGDMYRNQYRGYAFSDTAITQIRKMLGEGADLNSVADMVDSSAPCRHGKGNRRYGALVFRVDHNIVFSAAQFDNHANLK